MKLYLKKKNIVFVPVGSVEQYSPYDLIETDFITAEHIARQAGEAMDILVAPTLCYRYEPTSYGLSRHRFTVAGDPHCTSL